MKLSGTLVLFFLKEKNFLNQTVPLPVRKEGRGRPEDRGGGAGRVCGCVRGRPARARGEEEVCVVGGGGGGFVCGKWGGVWGGEGG